MKDRTTAIILALFLGGFGIHQFYLGNNTKGVLYLIFCWTLIPVFIAIIDIIILITTNDQSFNLMYNSNIKTSYTNINSTSNHNPQKDYNEYIRYVKSIDLNYIQNGNHGIGSHNEVLQKMIIDYRYLCTLPIDQLKSDEVFLRFKKAESYLNSENKLIGGTNIDYWDYLSSHLDKPDHIQRSYFKPSNEEEAAFAIILKLAMQDNVLDNDESKRICVAMKTFYQLDENDLLNEVRNLEILKTDMNVILNHSLDLITDPYRLISSIRLVSEADGKIDIYEKTIIDLIAFKKKVDKSEIEQLLNI